MTRSDIMTILTEELRMLLPDVDPTQVTPQTSMADLGADSLDRSEVVQQTMRRLGIRLKPMQLNEVRNLGDLADLMAHAVQVA